MGRKRRITTYQQAAERRVKNINTRRTTSAIVQRDVRDLASSSKNKRLK